jgi:DNA-binding XRE family transcriptional regulator
MSARGEEARRQRREALRQELYERVKAGDLDLAEAVRMMRKVAGKTQAEYAQLVGISPRVLIDFERGVGNPTLATLRKILAPFGLELTVRRRTSAVARRP